MIFLRLFILYTFWNTIVGSKFKITEIQIGFGLSNYRFAQMRDNIPQKLKEKRFANIILAKNVIRRNI